MNAINVIKSGLIIGISASAITLGACASSGYNGDSRYGSVYNYESGGSAACNTAPNCGVMAQAAPAAPVATASRYGSVETTTQVVTQPVPVYTSPAPAPVYTAPAPAPTYTAQTTYSGTVNCPAGTTANSDGTCMMNSNVESYTGTSTYSGTVTTGTSTYGGVPASCPAGTTPSGDGTCMMNNGYSGTTTTTTTSGYSGGYTTGSSYSGGPVDCPAGTTDNGDGTCMMSGSGTITSQPSVTIYQGTTTSGYETPSDYVAPIYQPIRK